MPNLRRLCLSGRRNLTPHASMAERAFPLRRLAARLTLVKASYLLAQCLLSSLILSERYLTGMRSLRMRNSQAVQTSQMRDSRAEPTLQGLILVDRHSLLESRCLGRRSSTAAGSAVPWSFQTTLPSNRQD